MDRVSLSRLVPVEMYDVGATLGDFLIATGKAEFVSSASPAVVIPIDIEPTSDHLIGGVTIEQPRAERRTLSAVVAGGGIASVPTAVGSHA